jgi:cell division protein FtsZ
VKEGLINLDFADVRAVMREMGKAMMGTGEASGEKRALSAAEAAIANPLIDDASMKGAKGLLISITGGKDLTLYEVDEAATRIREEVDQDANIIVGATFDETLEGLIRVSVVATGIDQALTQRAPAPDGRIAELTQKLRADQQRERIDRHEPRTVPLTTPTIPASHPPSMPESIETAARAAVAAALLPMGGHEDVTIRPIQPKPSLFPETAPPPAQEAPTPRNFIPPSPERPANRQPRMPRIDEFPLPGQNELRAKRGEGVEQEPPEKRRVGLLRRLAAVGLGRRDPAEPEKMPSNVRPVRPAPRPADRAPPPPLDRAPPPPPRPVARPPEPRGPEPVSEYARRPAHQGLDPHGRPAPVHNNVEDDQLDIPAFLRRQAN